MDGEDDTQGSQADVDVAVSVPVSSPMLLPRYQ